MSKRDRFGDSAPYVTLIIGLVVIAVLGWSYWYSKGYQRANEDHQSASAARDQTQKNYEHCRMGSTIDDALKCFAAEESASREDQTAKQDLNAQREMADWAEGMLWSSLLSVAITAVGVFYVALTLREARSTTKAAIRGTALSRLAVREARETNRITENSGFIGNRPWLTIKDPSLTYILVIPGGFEGGDLSLWIEYCIEIENVGRTPARNVNAYSLVFSTVDRDFSGQLDLARKAVLKDELGLAIAPNERRIFRRSCTVDVSLPPEGSGHTILLGAVIACGYAVDGYTRRETYRTFALSQEQGGRFKGGATMTGLDLHDIAQGKVDIEFRSSSGDMT